MFGERETVSRSSMFMINFVEKAKLMKQERGGREVKWFLLRYIRCGILETGLGKEIDVS